jgi:ARG/rhodanese/phosphatase superfamily protein
MRTLLAVLAISGCAAAGADPNPKREGNLDPHARLLAPIQVQSLTLLPIAAVDPPKSSDDLLVLDEAMPKKLVAIKEVDGGSVNNLTLTNKADKPLFLLAGEVIIGGHQDRIIGSNTIIPAKTTQDVPVFCVEHGRWSGPSNEFTTANALAHGRLRGKTFDGQQDVWDEVATKNTERKTASATGTYRKVAQSEADGSLGGEWKKQVDAALAKLPDEDRKNLVGFAVAVDGKVATIDRFSSPALFGKLENKLLRSYITEAVDVKSTGKAAPTVADVKSFIADAEKAKSEDAYATAAAASEVQKGQFSAKAKVMYKPAKSAGPAAATAAAPPAPTEVYETYQAR